MQNRKASSTKTAATTMMAMAQPGSSAVEVELLMQSLVKLWHWLFALQQSVAHSPFALQLPPFASFPSPVKHWIATDRQVWVPEVSVLTSQQVPRAHTELSAQLVIPL